MKDKDVTKRFEAVASSRVLSNIVQNFHLNKKKVLDIGCSYGEFLIQFGPKSLGVTCAMEEAEYGKKENLSIVFGNIEDPRFVLKEKFDVIWANNLFEHLYSPHQFLINIRRLIKKDGFLILGVPTIPFFSSLTKIKLFNGAFASAHINFFTKHTLKATVERSGWHVKDIRAFYFKNRLFDKLLDSICPHFYVIAVPNMNFSYSKKRLKELAGYRGFKNIE